MATFRKSVIVILTVAIFDFLIVNALESQADREWIVSTTSHLSTQSANNNKNIEAGKIYFQKSSDVQTQEHVGMATAIAVSGNAPECYVLEQNFPNPFNPETTVKFGIKDAGLVSLKVYNLIGQVIRVLVEEVMTPGTYDLKWNGVDDRGSYVPSGIYFYELEVNGFRQVRKMTLRR